MMDLLKKLLDGSEDADAIAEDAGLCPECGEDDEDCGCFELGEAISPKDDYASAVRGEKDGLDGMHVRPRGELVTITIATLPKGKAGPSLRPKGAGEDE
jgi:hypothetical protein